MKLLTKELEKRFAEIGRQESNENAIVVAKYFNPCGAGTGYATEYDSDTETFFGYVSIFGDHNDEGCYFSLAELEEYKSPFGLGIERDMYCKEQTIKEGNISSLQK